MTEEKKKEQENQAKEAEESKQPEAEAPEAQEKKEQPKEAEVAPEPKAEAEEAPAEEKGADEPKTEEKAEVKQEAQEEKKEEAAKEDAVPAAEEEKEAEAVEHTIRGMVGKKLGMTQIFDNENNVLPVTVIEAGPCIVLETSEKSNKVTLGFDSIKESHVNKPRLGYFKKIGQKPFRIVKEVASTDSKTYSVGAEIKADVFKPGDYVDVTGTSIGKGFQGGMKKHGWGGGPAGHGSHHHRRVGSIGASADPSKTVRGFPMPGQMGNQQVTTQGLRVMEVDPQNNLLLVKGAIPGSKNGVVSINLSDKKEWKSLEEKKAVVKHKVNPMKQSKAKAKGKG